MFYKINRHLPDKKHFILTSLNKLLDKKLKKYSSFFKSLTYKTENAFHYAYYFHINLTNFVLNKKEIYSIISENNPVYYNKSSFFYENQLIGIATTEVMSGNDIVSGLPKLNSLMENSFDSENSQYLELFFDNSVNYLTDITINNYNLYFSKKKEYELDKRNHKRENKDPELYLWFLFSNYKKKNSLSKSLRYSILKVKQTILNSLMWVYKEQNIKLHSKIFSNVVNTMFNKVFIAEALSNPLLKNDEIYVKLYLKLVNLSKSLNFIPPIGLIIVEGISKSVTGSLRLLNSISFRDTTNNLVHYSLYQPNDWLTSIKSKLILGQKTDIGTSILSGNKPLAKVNNFMVNAEH